jgi:shikimate kinase
VRHVERSFSGAPRAIILIGFMGAGKSSVGRALAAELGWEFEDLDERIERRERRTIREIFRDAGEAEFRKSEHAVLKEALGDLQSGTKRIMALGGGAFVQELNAALIKSSGIPTAFLDGSVEVLWERCLRQSAQRGVERPLMGNERNFRTLYERRRPHYLKASLRQETGGKDVEQIAAEIVQALGLRKQRKSRNQGGKR